MLAFPWGMKVAGEIVMRQPWSFAWVPLCVLALAAGPARAQTFGRVIDDFSQAITNTLNLRPRDVTDLQLGLGPGFSPAFEGSREYKWHAVPIVSLQYRDVLRVNNNDVDFTAFDKVISLGDDLGTSKLEIGPGVSLDFGRGEHDSTALRGMGDVGFALEVGGYVAYTLERVRVELEAGQSVTGGHGGGIAELHLTGTLYRGERFAVGAGGTLALATSKYLKSFFGVTPAQAARSGLPAFHPSGGLKSAVIGVQGNYTLTPTWALLAHVGYERLLGDAAASPLIKQRGDANQATASAFAVYTF